MKKRGKLLSASYINAIIIVTLVLFLGGVFGLMMIQSQQLLRLFKEQVMIVLEIEKDASSEEVAKEIRLLEGTKPNSVQITKKEAGLAMIQADFGEKFDQNLDANPLFDLVTFHVLADYVEHDNLAKIAQELETDDRISGVFYEKGITNNIASNWSGIASIGLGISVIFLFVVWLLISYAVKQALNDDRFLIKRMQLVGATPSFISRPYIQKSALSGLFSAGVAITLLFLLRGWLSSRIDGIIDLMPLQSVLILSLLMIVLGVLIMSIGASFTLKRYLKASVNDLY